MHSKNTYAGLFNLIKSYVAEIIEAKLKLGMGQTQLNQQIKK